MTAAVTPPAPAADPVALASTAAAVRADLQRWRKHFPALDTQGRDFALLVELYVAEMRGETLIKTSAAGVGGCPVTTGYRVIERLIAGGLAAEEGDASDLRHVRVRLTETGRAAIERCLAMTATDWAARAARDDRRAFSSIAAGDAADLRGEILRRLSGGRAARDPAMAALVDRFQAALWRHWEGSERLGVRLRAETAVRRLFSGDWTSGAGAGAGPEGRA